MNDAMTNIGGTSRAEAVRIRFAKHYAIMRKYHRAKRKPKTIYIYGQSLVKYMSTQNVEEMIDKGSADKALTNFLDEFTITTQS